MLKGNERASSPFACRLNGMATRRCSLVSFIPAILLLHRDIIFDASRFVVVESCARIGDPFVSLFQDPITILVLPAFRIFLAVTLSPCSSSSSLPLLLCHYSPQFQSSGSLPGPLVTRIDTDFVDTKIARDLERGYYPPNICSYRSNCFLSRNDLIIVDSPLAASPL